MKHWRLAGGAVVGAVLCASAAGAQTQLTSDALAQGRPSRSMEFDGSMRVEYDSNIDRTSPQLAAQEGLTPGDVLYAPTLNADVVLPIGRQAVFLDGSVGYLGHDHNTQLDHARVNVEGGGGGVLGPCSSVITGAYFQGRSELENTTLTTTVQDLQQTTRLDLGVSCIRRPSIVVSVDASRLWASNSLPMEANGNYVTTTFTGTASFRRPSLGSIGLFVSDAKTDYSDLGLMMIQGASGYEALSGGLNLERKLGGRIEAAASVSYTSVDIQRPVIVGATTGQPSGFNGLTYSGNISFRATSRLSASASFERAVKPSLIPGGSFELDSTYGVGLTYKLGSRIRLAVTGRDLQVDIHGDFPVAAATLTNAQTKNVQASIQYTFTKHLSLTLAGLYETRDANNPLFEYDNKTVSLTADARF